MGKNQRSPTTGPPIIFLYRLGRTGIGKVDSKFDFKPVGEFEVNVSFITDTNTLAKGITIEQLEIVSSSTSDQTSTTVSSSTVLPTFTPPASHYSVPSATHYSVPSVTHYSAPSGNEGADTVRIYNSAAGAATFGSIFLAMVL